MKILATADWHLGAYIGPQCDDPMKRMENTIKCLDILKRTVYEEKPDIILIAGDIFHAAKVWSDRVLVETRTAAEYLRRLSNVAPIGILYGTPSHESLQSYYALSDMLHGCSDDIFFFTEPGLYKFSTKSGPIQIAGLPGFDKGHFRAQFPGLSAEEENQVFTQQLASIIQGLSAQIDPTIPSVLMAHHTVVGCDMGTGTHIFQANEVVLDAATLDNSAFDLVCLGHIHKAQELDACNKPVYYSGSIDAFTFNDEENKKGFWMHNLPGLPINGPWNGFRPTYDNSNFIETPAREFLTIYFEQDVVKGFINGNPDDAFLIGFPWKIAKDKVVRVLYTCDSETEKALDKKKLERDLYAAGAYYVSEIRPESITASVNREGMTEKLTVEDCLNEYLFEKHPSMIPEINLAIQEMAIPIIAEAQASSPMGSTSGLFLPVEIEVHNYRSYADEKLSFQDIFFAMVNGINGSGKSSLFMDAITDCLYEETREKELTGWIRNGEKSGSISFTFSLGADLWRVTRTRSKSKGTLALAKWKLHERVDREDRWIDHSCELMKETQQKIINLLGMDCDTFQSCVLIMQDRYGKFMEASKDDRMAVLANLLGLGIYDELAKIASGKLTDANREVKIINANIANLESEVSNEDSLHTELEQVQAELSTAAGDLTENKENLASVNSTLGAMAGYDQEASRLEINIKAVTDQHTEKKARRVDLQKRIEETETFLQGEAKILDKCAELDASRLEIAAMDGKLQLLNDKQQRCRKLNMDLSAAEQFRKNTAITIDAINNNLEDEGRLEKIVVGSTVEHDLEECEKKEQDYKNLDNTLTIAVSQLTFHNEKNNNEIASLDYRIRTLTKQTEMLGNANCVDLLNAHCKFLQSAKEAKVDIETLLLEKQKTISDGDEKKLKLSDTIQKFQTQLMEVGYDASLQNNLLHEVRIFRTAKDQLAKLAGATATAEGLKKQDADARVKILEYESELALLEIDIAQLSSATNQVSALKARINELLSYEQMKMQLPKAKQFVESSLEVINQLGTDLDELMNSFNSINERLTELKTLTTGKEFLQQNSKSLEKRINIIEGWISTLNQRIGTISAQLQAIDRKKDILTASREGLQQAAKKAVHLTVLSEAFSQDGIPYQIIRDIVPELEAAANEILGQMTGGRMRLEFITEKVLKSNKAKEVATLEIIIIDVDNGVLPYLSRSGGQKVRAALANSFALAMIKASRIGLQLGMLFIDEPSFLDADGIEGYCTALETIHNRYPDMRILAISHDENMKSRFPQQLHVDMTENGSKVRRL
jgi:exonuclease SbcC